LPITAVCWARLAVPPPTKGIVLHWTR
jgi:hypothetical protein